MYLKLLFVFIAISSCTSTSPTGLRLLFPQEHRIYIFSLKSNVSTGTWTPRQSTTSWQLEATLNIQVYDNFTKARLFLEGLKDTVQTGNFDISGQDNPDEKYLKDPWELEYQENGYIKSIYVGHEEPVWSVNLKRAISINLQVTKGDGTYSINEPCLDEICAMVYLSQGNIIKKYTSVRVPAVNSRSSWSSVPWSLDYAGRAIIDSVNSAERTYNIDDYKGLSSLQLQASYQYKTHEHILTVNTGLSLAYEYDTPAESVEKLNLYQTSIQYWSSDYRNPSNGIRNVTQEHLKNSTYDMLLRIAKKGIDADNIVRNASLIHSVDFIELLNTIARLDKDTLVRLFDDLVLGTSYEMETARNIFLEVLPHARSHSSVRFIKYLVLEEKENLEDAALLSLIRKIPFNVAGPTQKLLEELEVISKLGLDFSSDIRHAGILSFATLLHKTMTISQVKQDYFDNIVVKYFRMYSDCPQYLDRMIWLQGLCNMGYSAESYTKIIHTETSRSRHERLWAGLARNPRIEDPYVIIETTLPIITNSSEHIQLRVTALHMFLSSSNVRESDFLSVHNYIIRCDNNQLKRFWYATIRNLEANKYFSGYKVTSYYVPFVINQISNPDPLYWATNNYIISAQEEDGAPSLQVLSIGDAEGVLPTFIGAKLCTGGRRPYRADIYLLVEGVAMSIFKRFHHFNSEDMKVEDLVEILKKLKAWSAKVPDKIHIDMIAKIHGKTVFASHMNQSRFESWNGEDLAYVEDFLRFGSHINQQIVYYPFQTDVHIPSEMGTPIRLQSTILSFTSIRGNLTAPSTQDLTWKNDLHIRYQGTSVTTISTNGPLSQSLHSARIQQSIVGHVPMKFNVSFSIKDQFLELTWPNPGAQQGGIAMHSRAQIAVETPNNKSSYTVTVGERKSTNVEETGVFFDCERPITGAEVLDKLFTSKTNHYDFITSIQPSLIILNSILLFTSPPSGSCGLILPPQHLMKTHKDVLSLKIQVNHINVNEDTSKFDLNLALSYFSENPKRVFFEMEALTKVENEGGNINLQLTIHGLQPSIDNNTTRKEWTVCLREQDISHAASDQDISIHPASHEGHLTLTYSGHKSDCFESGPASELTLKYKRAPQNLYGKLERYFEVKIFGSNLSEMGILESELVTQTALGQLVRSYSKEPLNMTAIIKENNGFASVSVNKGAEMQFKSDNFAWLLDSWTEMRIMKTLGLYRECRLQEGVVNMLFGETQTLTASKCTEAVVLADCSKTPRFAVIRQKDGIRIYSGGYHVLVKIHEDLKPVVDSTHAGNNFWISQFRSTVRIISRSTDLQVYYNHEQLVILVPHVYLNTVCGICTDKTYNLC